ncbi:SDR family oxidoreductase [Candidatus Bipolaricaulota bacterium]|nr:SDR family oxidoreductase [Candidatus Bipolaricaulota bacterium]
MRKPSECVVLVTGASSGIGRACAVELSRRGHTVYGTTRRQPLAIQAEVGRDLDPSHRLQFLQVDVTDCHAVQDAVDHVLSETGRIDALINCAGFGSAGAVEDTSDADLRALLDTNLVGTLRCCRAVLPRMRLQHSGTIINISSIAGRMGIPFQGGYSASKYALEGLSEALRMEVHPFGVKVVLIEPGDFRTEFTERRQITSLAKANETYAAQMRKTLSVMEAEELGGATPEPVARLVGRILDTNSPRVRYVVGPFSERIAAGLKRVLPSKWFERILMMYYRIGGNESGRENKT